MILCFTFFKIKIVVSTYILLEYVWEGVESCKKGKDGNCFFFFNIVLLTFPISQIRSLYFLSIECQQKVINHCNWRECLELSSLAWVTEIASVSRIYWGRTNSSQNFVGILDVPSAGLACACLGSCIQLVAKLY